jgi:hypothetical protein
MWGTCATLASLLRFGCLFDRLQHLDGAAGLLDRRNGTRRRVIDFEIELGLESRPCRAGERRPAEPKSHQQPEASAAGHGSRCIELLRIDGSLHARQVHFVVINLVRLVEAALGQTR